MNVIDSIVTQAASIAAVRPDIHPHPELGFEERRTADVVAQKLTEWGIPVHRGLGKTGVVGIVKGRDGGARGRGVGLGAGGGWGDPGGRWRDRGGGGAPGVGWVAFPANTAPLPMQEFNSFAHASR